MAQRTLLFLASLAACLVAARCTTYNVAYEPGAKDTVGAPGARPVRG
jgi:hypothetical protein